MHIFSDNVFSDHFGSIHGDQKYTLSESEKILHYVLPIHQRLKYCTLGLIYRILTEDTPKYMKPLVHEVIYTRELRSKYNGYLCSRILSKNQYTKRRIAINSSEYNSIARLICAFLRL